VMTLVRIFKRKKGNIHTFFMAHSRCVANRFGFGFLPSAFGNL